MWALCFICTLDSDWSISSDTAPSPSRVLYTYLQQQANHEGADVTCPVSSMNTFIHDVHACHFLRHSPNTQMLCYAKQYCFPNKLCFMSEPAEQGLDRVSLSGSTEPWSLFLSPAHSVSSAGPLKTHLVFFDTTNMPNTADPDPDPH